MPILLALLLCGAQVPAGPHGKDYWRDIAKARFEVPVGESPGRLAPELAGYLGSTDPELRDDLAFTILAAWIYEKKSLGPDDLRPLVQALQGSLVHGLTTPGTDAVFRRSFSALTLSIVAARDNVTPFLSAPEYEALLDAALAYFRDERDLRGFDPQKGWIHTAAHTADLLKFLARNPHLRPVDQSRILTALLEKNRSAASAFAQGEDERMARVAISIARRDDFDRDAFRAWLTATQAAAVFPNPPAVASLRSYQNVRRLLASLWTELSADERPSAGADFARSALREVIKKLF